MKKIIALLVLTLISSNIHAMTGTDLFLVCQEYAKSSSPKEIYNVTDFTKCSSYIDGVLETYDASIQLYKIPAFICIPNNSKKWQLKLIAYKYLKDNPAELHYTAASLDFID